MDGKSPEDQWNRLQQKYKKGVQASYPNPERRGCPETNVLQDLAARSAQYEEIEEDQHWKHVVHCGPCYQQYLDLRESYRVAEKPKVHRKSQ